uniref:Uncharacterized protein n=1 Tax=Oryza brachyantha TaxID=4533 RepID=J3LBJ2_ORYBR
MCKSEMPSSSCACSSPSSLSVCCCCCNYHHQISVRYHSILLYVFRIKLFLIGSTRLPATTTTETVLSYTRLYYVPRCIKNLDSCRQKLLKLLFH